MKLILNRFLLCSAVILLYPQFATAAVPVPLEYVKKEMAVVQEALQKMGGNSSNKEYLKLVETSIYPKVNFLQAAKLSLGKHWRNITAEQQQEFVDEFSDLLKYTYANATRLLTQTTFQYMPANYKNGDTDTEIKFSAFNPNKNENAPIEAGFRLALDGEIWKIYDLSIGKIWLTQNYRTAFDRQISGSSFDKFMASLKEKNKELAAKFK